MTVEEFVTVCEDFNDNLSKIANNTSGLKNDMNQAMISLKADIEQIMKSNGLIQTEDPTIRESFREVFDAARGIMNYTSNLNQCENEINQEMNRIPCDKDKLTELGNHYTLEQKLLIDSYNKALGATEKAMNLETKKTTAK